MSNEARIIPVGEEPPPMYTPDEEDFSAAEQAKQPAENGAARRVSEGRFQDLNAFVDETMASLKRAELAVWMVLYRDWKKGLARTAQEDIARRAGCDRRSVNRALRTLQQRGLVETVHQGGLNRGLSVYRLHPVPLDLGTPVSH